MYFIPLYGNSKTLFFIKIYRYSEDYTNRHVATFFEISVLKEFHVLRYLLLFHPAQKR